MERTSNVDYTKILMRNANCTCGDCKHFSDLGCWEAAEALALEGYPRAVVLVKDYMSAEGCPSYSEADKCEEFVWENSVDAAYAAKAGK